MRKFMGIKSEVRLVSFGHGLSRVPSFASQLVKSLQRLAVLAKLGPYVVASLSGNA